MARVYAPPAKMAGLSGTVQTTQGGVVVPPGSPLEPGETFDVQYFFTGTYEDANGTSYKSRFFIDDLQNVSTGMSNAGIVKAIQAKRAELRLMAQRTVGPPVTTL